jgi:hypothetical protein
MNDTRYHLKREVSDHRKSRARWIGISAHQGKKEVL